MYKIKKYHIKICLFLKKEKNSPAKYEIIVGLGLNQG